MNSIAKYNVLNEDLQHLINEWHDAFWADPFFQTQRNWRPTDVVENEEGYTIEIELPRFKRQDIRVEAVKGYLKVFAKNQRASYMREFNLPYGNLNESDIKLADGVLTISVPKSGDGRPKLLEIK